MLAVKPDNKKKEVDVKLDGEMAEVCKMRYESELLWMTKNSVPMFKFLSADDKNRNWSFCFNPELPPFNSGSFRLSVLLPFNYPFKPPSINFMTKIMHPNVDEAGNMSIPGLKSEEWKPTMTIRDVLIRASQTILDLDSNRPLRADIADLLASNEPVFMQRAIEYTKKFAEKR
ncbi:unnamed protein product [Bursaphelenchus xylophilus]|uniref:(pine wood nematode) hypothetical protein n=1 Tax=Bursaphelenchus xylophilus TaxID=6326 RepID=A0A1I7SWF7_BURXY|nr:unnamed protein product [Bursaphelenchus xylophilus]CAG9099344.1 unnamed protein product [Bursaphelenchus xylophilus]